MYPLFAHKSTFSSKGLFFYDPKKKFGGTNVTKVGTKKKLFLGKGSVDIFWRECGWEYNLASSGKDFFFLEEQDFFILFLVTWAIFDCWWSIILFFLCVIFFVAARGYGLRVVGGCSSPGHPGNLRARVARITPGSGADFAGIRRGDIVLTWNGVKLSNMTFEEVCKILDTSGDTAELTIASLDR